MDVCKVLKSLDGCDGYDKVLIDGQFPIKDKFGNTRDGTVLAASYSRGAIERINWRGFEEGNVLDIAESGVYIHKDFRY